MQRTVSGKRSTCGSLYRSKQQTFDMVHSSSLLILAMVLGACLADESLQPHWNSFKKAFKKKFENSNQEETKKEQWTKNVKMVLQHNLQADMGEHSYKKAVNEFSDFSQEEIETKLCGLKVPANATREFRPFPLHKKTSARALPANHDWRSFNVVTSVKNQGTCGSCWTFAVAGALEGMWARKSGQAVDLSEQQMLDCSAGYGTTGCNGGWPNDAYRYIQDYGIETYNCYPYENQVKQCRYNQNCRVTGITNFYDVPRGDENALLEYLYNYGPMSVAVHVNNNFSAYSGGIFFDNGCNQAVNHAVLLVGYGVDNGIPYWTIKNSWGGGWGEKGYIRLARNRNNMCKVADFAAFPYLQ